MSARVVRVGLVGARGFVGAELIALVAAHPSMRIEFASSRQGAGQQLSERLRVEELTPEQVGTRDVDAYVLALPNSHSAAYLACMRADAVVVDLSADHRFDDAWAYGLPEHHRAHLKGAKRIANPGCYATGGQLGLRPLLDLVDGVPHVFGVSGYSGAGTTPSDNNNPDVLSDNLIPYALVDHMHEREMARHLKHPIAFMPHVAPFFRGITLTMSMALKQHCTATELIECFKRAYAAEPLVRIVGSAVPRVRDSAHQHHVTVGGVCVDAAGTRASVVVTLDNLLKGAATQALQNLNLAFGLPELAGIDAVRA